MIFIRRIGSALIVFFFPLISLQQLLQPAAMQTFHLNSVVLPFLLFSWLVTLVAAAGDSPGSLPSCSQICDYIETDLDAYCGRRNLTSVPYSCNGSVYLDMRANNLRDLRQGDFGAFHHLKFLDLSQNSIESLRPRIFVGATHLEHVYISSNHLMNVGHDAFAGAGNIRSIYLSRNDIQALSSTVFRDLPNLKVLYLSNNRLSYVNRHMFRHNTNLTHLSFAHNQLEVLLAETFMDLTKLEFVDFSFNALHDLPAPAFVGFSYLQTFRANNNTLTSSVITPELFLGSPRLEIVDLSGNQIVTIPSDIEESHLPKLRLSGNPLVCDCSLRPLQNLYLDLRSDEDWVEQVTCSSGELVISATIECPTSPPNMDITQQLGDVADEEANHQSGSNATEEDDYRGGNSRIIHFMIIIVITVFVVCCCICLYITVKWVISCQNYDPENYDKVSECLSTPTGCLSEGKPKHKMQFLQVHV
ncbi:hypothetical protein BSL78_11854 [Apostichopus japonicus]|uniref:Uncharacterized protein n=1 Tax=Stichopus japonicus TaxID=307972 RepID=A0A2G8KTC8_STIJA|nr:hypothetical protein BSL78_11854 [Apostichopus japonicus]